MNESTDSLNLKERFLQWIKTHRVKAGIAFFLTAWITVGGAVSTWKEIFTLISPTRRAKSQLEERGIEFREAEFFDAVKRGDLEVARLFLRAGIRPDCRNESRQTTLMLPATLGYEEIVHLLIKNGVDVNAVDEQSSDFLSGTSSPLIYACRVNEPNLRIVIALIKAGANVNHENDEGTTPISAAIPSRSVELLEALIKAGADVNRLSKRVSSNLLLEACLWGGPDIVELLVHNGADVNFIDKNRHSVLARAVSVSGPPIDEVSKIAEILIQAGADVNRKLEAGQTALFWANDAKVIKTLVKRGADVNIANNKGYTVLMNRAMSGDKESVEFLISMGADVNAKTKSGDSALSFAEREKRLEIVEILRNAR